MSVKRLVFGFWGLCLLLLVSCGDNEHDVVESDKPVALVNEILYERPISIEFRRGRQSIHLEHHDQRWLLKGRKAMLVEPTVMGLMFEALSHYRSGHIVEAQAEDYDSLGVGSNTSEFIQLKFSDARVVDIYLGRRLQNEEASVRFFGQGFGATRYMRLVKHSETESIDMVYLVKDHGIAFPQKPENWANFSLAFLPTIKALRLSGTEADYAVQRASPFSPLQHADGSFLGSNRSYCIEDFLYEGNNSGVALSVLANDFSADAIQYSLEVESFLGETLVLNVLNNSVVGGEESYDQAEVDTLYAMPVASMADHKTVPFTVTYQRDTKPLSSPLARSIVEKNTQSMRELEGRVVYGFEKDFECLAAYGGVQ